MSNHVPRWFLKGDSSKVLIQVESLNLDGVPVGEELDRKKMNDNSMPLDEMLWMVLSYCSISLGRQRGWWGLIVSVSLCYALKCSVWWIRKSDGFYVYQCNSEALVVIYLRNVLSLSLFFFFVLSLSFFFFSFRFLSALTCPPVKLQSWTPGRRSSFQKSHWCLVVLEYEKWTRIVIVEMLMMARGWSLLFLFVIFNVWCLIWIAAVLQKRIKSYQKINHVLQPGNKDQ